MTSFGFKLFYVSRIARYQNCPLDTFGAEKFEVKFLTLTLNFSGRGVFPTPKFSIVGKPLPSTISSVNLLFLFREIRKCRRSENYDH